MCLESNVGGSRDVLEGSVWDPMLEGAAMSVCNGGGIGILSVLFFGTMLLGEEAMLHWFVVLRGGVLCPFDRLSDRV